MTLIFLNSCKKDEEVFIPPTEDNRPGTPTLIMPDTSKTGNYIMVWNRMEKALSYSLQEDQNPGFDSAKVIYTGTDTVLRITGKPFNKVFYYRVRASNSYGNSAWSSTYSIIVLLLPEPNLNVGITNLDFGDVLTGQSKLLPSIISNTGSALLVIHSITINNLTYSVQNNLPITIANGASETLNVIFSPNFDTSIPAKLTLTSNDPDDFPKIISCSGRGIRKAQIRLSTNQMNFGDVRVDSTKDIGFFVLNTGNDVLLLTEMNFNKPSFSTTTTFPITIAPNDSAQLHVKFQPTTRGWTDASLFVYCSDSTNVSPSVLLSGKGVAPAILTTPSANIIWGDVPVWLNSQQAIKIENDGERNLIITDIVSDNQQFEILGSTNFTLVPNTKDTFSVNFIPQTEGDKNATITILSNDPVNSEYQIHAIGFGSLPHIWLSSNNLDYGDVEVTLDKNLSLTIKNVGRATLSLLTFDINNVVFSTNVVFPKTILPNNQIVFPIIFKPNTLGENRAALTIDSNDSLTSPSTVNLIGYGETHIIYDSGASMSASRWEYASCSVGGKIYIAGGSGSQGYSLNSLEIYDTAFNSWTNGSNMSVGREFNRGVSLNGKFYVIGGGIRNVGYTGLTEVYNPATDHWTTLAPMPTPRAQFGIAIYNDTIYCFGGNNQSGVVGKVEAYEPNSNTWFTRQDLPTPRYELQAEELNGKIYVVGGRSSNGTFLSTVEIYNPFTNSWINGTSLPVGNSSFGMAKVHNRLYVFGGYKYNEPVREFVPTKNIWNDKGQFIYNAGGNKSGINAVTIHNKIFLVGGNDGSNIVSIIFP